MKGSLRDKLRSLDLKPRLLDIYITRKFILTFFASLVLIIGIVIIFDISEKIDDFVSTEAPIKAIIIDYYLNFVPYFTNMFSPLFVFITVIFFTSRLAANSEIVAILSCGVSFHRLMVPYIFSAALVALLSLGLNLFVIPGANQKRVEFEVQYLKNRTKYAGRNVHYQLAPGEFVYVESFSTWNNTAYRITLETVKDNKLIKKLSAESAVWDSTKGHWTFRKYMIRDYNDGIQDRIRTGAKLDTTLALTVDDFVKLKNKVETLNYYELNDYIETQELRGDPDVKLSLIEKHKRYALPFSAFVLTIMGVALSSRKTRAGIGINIAVGIALAFTYILFLRFSEMFVYTDTLSPAVALWLPNFIYAIITAFLYRIAPK